MVTIRPVDQLVRFIATMFPNEFGAPTFYRTIGDAPGPLIGPRTSGLHKKTLCFPFLVISAPHDRPHARWRSA